MKAHIINNLFETMGIEGQYEVLNPDNLEYDINCIVVTDINGNKKFIPSNITETTCDIIINPNYTNNEEE